MGYGGLLHKLTSNRFRGFAAVVIGLGGYWFFFSKVWVENDELLRNFFQEAVGSN